MHGRCHECHFCCCYCCNYSGITTLRIVAQISRICLLDICRRLHGKLGVELSLGVFTSFA